MAAAALPKVMAVLPFVLDFLGNLQTFRAFARVSLVTAALPPMLLLPTSFSPAAIGHPTTPSAESAWQPWQPRTDLEQLAAALRKAGKVAEAQLELLDRQTFELPAVLAAVGRDVHALQRWVAQRTRWVPYQGVLRGSLGVLMDRRGNHLDRSLLLAELLVGAGHEVRLQRGRIPEPAIAPLLQAALASASAPDELPAPAATLQQISERSGVPASELERLRTSRPARGERLAEDIARLAAAQSPRLAAAVGIAGPGADAQREQAARHAAETAAAAAMADFFWVQVQQDGDWIDCPLLPGDADFAGLGVTAAETLAPGALPPEWFHRVTVRVLAERWDGEANTAVAVEQEFAASDMVQTDLRVVFQPLGASPKPGFDDDATLRAVATATAEWLPILQCGKRAYKTASIRSNGTLNQKPALGAKGQKLQRGVDALQGLGEKTAPGHSECTAVWIEYASTGPGAAPRTVRREVFDLRGPAARAGATAVQLDDDARLRRGLGFCSGTSVQITPCALSSQWLVCQQLQALVKTRTVMLEQLYAVADGDAARATAAARRLQAPATELQALDLLRHRLLPQAEAVFVAQPNIVTSHDYSVAEGGKLVPMRAIDIVANPLGVLPLPGLTIRRVRLDQGVLDTVTEQQLLGAAATGNTSQLYERSLAKGVAWHALREAGDLEKTKALPEDLRARMRADLGDGSWVCAPEQTVECDGRSFGAWWRIDPDSGETLGIGSHGWGQAMVETSELTSTELVSIMPASRIYGAVLACVAIVALAKVLLGLMCGALALSFPAVEVLGMIIDSAIDEHATEFVARCSSRLLGLPT